MKQTKSLTSLFLAQSYQDAWDEYKRSLLSSTLVRWDYVILTASNEQQAKGFREQLEERKKNDFLPANTHFAVLPDPEGKRVGSGGATLGVIRYIAEQIGNNCFDNIRVLVIHSGGDSKRVPQYSALGKLFSPVPHELPNGRPSTLFDEIMIAMSSVPGRIREGMMLLSGDVLLLFNPLLIDYSGNGAAVISFKENVEKGKNHGVFLRGDDGTVKKCLQKQSVETLRRYGAVNDKNCVDIDTGAVIFSKEILKSFYNLISENGIVTEDLFSKYVNEKVRLSLYGDFLYPLASDSTLENFYEEKPEGEFCAELRDARKNVWNALRGYRMKLLRLAPAKFIHFGTSKEILDLMARGVKEHEVLGWKRNINSSVSVAVGCYNSVISNGAVCGKNCYLENSYVHRDCKIGDNVILSYIDVQNKIIPPNVVIHGLKKKDGLFVVRIYGVTDNPKGDINSEFLGTTLENFLKLWNLSPSALWKEGEEQTIWKARLYPSDSKTADKALEASLNLYDLMSGKGNLKAWLMSERTSLCSGFYEADNRAIKEWDTRMGDLVRMDRLSKLIDDGESAEKGSAILKNNYLTPIQNEWMEHKLCKVNLRKKIRLYYYVGTAVGGSDGEEMIAESFICIRDSILQNYSGFNLVHKPQKITVEKHTVKLPLRVNWGGGWSDTPPYCNEKGGTVLNAAIRLNGKCPVEVTLIRLNEKKIIFDSRDMDVHGEFESIEELQQTGDPFDPFALQKAALLASGIIPKAGGNLMDILENLGGGFEMHSEVIGVPKGSGLGTSSILAAACVKALLEFVGTEYTDDMLYSLVLCMEQIMSTGGGWQDQAGGLLSGVKIIFSQPGIHQDIEAQPVVMSEKSKKELQERFALIYTGERRLARNLLREVVGKYIGANPVTEKTLNEIQKLAVLMSFELTRGNIDEFAGLLNEHWMLSKKLDAGSSNILIEQIFNSIEDLIDGRMICGAGGGGFLQVILKKGVTRNTVHERLKSIFMDSDIDVWDSEFVW